MWWTSIVTDFTCFLDDTSRPQADSPPRHSGVSSTIPLPDSSTPPPPSQLGQSGACGTAPSGSSRGMYTDVFLDRTRYVVDLDRNSLHVFFRRHISSTRRFTSETQRCLLYTTTSLTVATKRRTWYSTKWLRCGTASRRLLSWSRWRSKWSWWRST